MLQDEQKRSEVLRAELEAAASSLDTARDEAVATVKREQFKLDRVGHQTEAAYAKALQLEKLLVHRCGVEAGYSCAEAVAAGYSLTQLHAAGYVEGLVQAGFSSQHRVSEQESKR